jgi:hypothetical protein
MWLIYAALHGVFVVGVAFFTESKTKTVWAAVIGAVVALAFGNPAFSAADLVGVVIGLWLGFKGISSTKKINPATAPTGPSKPAATNSSGPTTSGVRIVLFIGAIGLGIWFLLIVIVAPPPAQAPVSAPTHVVPAPAVTRALPPPVQPSVITAKPSAKRHSSNSDVSPGRLATVRTKEKTAAGLPNAERVTVPTNAQQRGENWKMPAVRTAVPERYPGNVDQGGHAGFAPSCRWVTPSRWSCD